MRSPLAIWREISEMGINYGDLVLEVGSGQHPHVRSDVLCDMFLDDNAERAKGSPIMIDRPIVCGNAEQLPFRDNAFDFLIASHLLEHLIYPEKFLEEAMRVSRKGLIVTPSELAEKIMGGWAFHLWLVTVTQGGSLLLTQKKSANEANVPPTLHQLWLRDRHFRQFYQTHLDVFETRYRWHDKFGYEIVRNMNDPVPNWLVKGCVPGSHVDSQVLPSSHKEASYGSWKWLPKTMAVQSRKLYSSIIRKAHGTDRPIDTMRLLACPVCHGGLQKSDNHSLCCVGCRRKYPVRYDGIPILLAEAALQ